MTSISELKTQLKDAASDERQYSLRQSSSYSLTLHYLAIDQASRIRYQLLNHSDLTIADHDELFRVKGDIPYPVSC